MGEKYTKKTLVPRAKAKKQQCPASVAFLVWFWHFTRVSTVAGKQLGFRGANARRLAFQAYQLNPAKIGLGSPGMRHHAQSERKAHYRPNRSTTAEPSCAREASNSKPPRSPGRKGRETS